MSTQPNSLMQQAAGMFSNPNAAAVPPASPGVIDPAQHPIIKAIIQALSQGAESYSMTAMDPRERMQRQEMDAQKAEAMARLGMEQQQLGYEGQRVGFEGQRTAADVARSGAQTEQAKAETAAIPQRTATEQKRAAIEQQRADQENANRKQDLDRQENQFKAEYGPGGLRSQELGIQKWRLAAEQQMNAIIKNRDEAEAQYHKDQLRAQGLQTDRMALEDQRKARYKVVDDTLDKHFWFYNKASDLAEAKQVQHAWIDKDINAQLAAAEKAAGTGAGAGWNPGQPGGALTQGNNPAPEGTVIQGPNGKMIKKGGQWQPQ